METRKDTTVDKTGIPEIQPMYMIDPHTFFLGTGQINAHDGTTLAMPMELMLALKDSKGDGKLNAVNLERGTILAYDREAGAIPVQITKITLTPACSYTEHTKDNYNRDGSVTKSTIKTTRIDKCPKENGKNKPVYGQVYMRPNNNVGIYLGQPKAEFYDIGEIMVENGVDVLALKKDYVAVHDTGYEDKELTAMRAEYQIRPVNTMNK